MAENVETKQVKSKQDLLKERLHSKYPDKDFSNDEDFYGQISDDFDDNDKRLEEYKGREKAFSDMFTSDPRSAAFITDWRNGVDPVISMVKRFGPELMASLDDPKMQEQLAEANKEYTEKLIASKDFDKRAEKNLNETLETLDKLVDDGLLDDDKIDDILDFFYRIVHDGVENKITRETILALAKALNYDTAVQDADRAGEVRGRNAKITEQLRKPTKGDQLPVLDGANGGEGTKKEVRRRNIFDIAKGAK